MLMRFEVENFRNFRENLLLDFSQGGQYEFNQECIKNNIIRSAVVYGKNGSGKSNLGLAIFDLITHVTDNNARTDLYEDSYLFADSESNCANFKFYFKFDNDIVEYSYTKQYHTAIESEHFKINGKEIISYTKGKILFVQLEGAETLNKDLSSNPSISAIKYIRSNSVLTQDHHNNIFKKFIDFVDKMLFFKSIEGNMYIGNRTGKRSLATEIISKNKVHDFEEFLNQSGVKCKLAVYEDEESNEKRIGFRFKNTIKPWKIASTGTKDLMLFYFWHLTITDDKCSFLFIDEFDAHYHFEASQLILNKLKQSSIQFLLTTHNTTLLSNDILRPDCGFIMNENKITSIKNSTEKELRQAHNLEKMYRAGSFN